MSWASFMQKSRKQQSKSKSNNKKRKVNPNSNNNKQSPVPKKRKISTISNIQCPICNKHILSHLIDFHMEEHFTNQTPKKNKKNLPEKSSNTNNNSNANNTNNNLKSAPTPPSKICPLFTQGALPSKMFTKSKKRINNCIPSQTAIFYAGIITDNTDRYITKWNTEWINNPTEIDTFLNKSREMNYFITNVFIREPNTNKRATKIYLITNYPSLKKDIQLLSNEHKFAYPSPNNYKFSPSLMKSLLQKCVRVSFDNSALKAAYLLLLKDSLTNLLRRLSIIIIEDVILMRDYILLIWLLLAESKSDKSEKYYPNIAWYNWLFTLVQKCAKYKIKDYINYKLYPNENQFIHLFTPFKNDNNIENNNIKQLLIRTMLIRASYGGMKCDVAMLRSYACIWHNRFFGQMKCNKFYNEQLGKLCVKNDIKNEMNNHRHGSEIIFDEILNRNNWLDFMNKLDEKYGNGLCVEMRDILAIASGDLILSAVDFHCSNMLDVLCNKKNGKCYGIIKEYLNNSHDVNLIGYKNNIDGLLKLMVWEFRSSQTNKIGLLMNEEKPMYLMELWSKLKPVVNDFSLRHFKSRTYR